MSSGNRRADTEVPTEYCCCKLRTAALIIGYIGAVAYPCTVIPFFTVQVCRYYSGASSWTIISWYKFGLNRFFDIVTTVTSVLLVLGINKGKLAYISLWIYVMFVHLLWNFINIVASVLFSDFICLTFFFVTIVWFVQGIFLVRAYKYSISYDNQFSNFMPLALNQATTRGSKVYRLSLRR